MNEEIVALPKFNLWKKTQEVFLRLLSPITEWFVTSGANPNHITTLGLVFAVVAALCIYFDELTLGGLFLFFSGIADILDGQIARRTKQNSKWGAMYDSFLDRYAEFIIYIALVGYFYKKVEIMMAVTLVAMVGSIMVSYARARAEGLGYECSVGFFQRPERVVMLAAAIMFNGLLSLQLDHLAVNILGANSELFHNLLIELALITIALFANFTALQRLMHVRSAWKVEQAQAEQDAANRPPVASQSPADAQETNVSDREIR